MLSRQADFPPAPHCGLSTTCSDAVLEGALVEDVGREGAECGMHPVLDLQADGADAQHHQALEERLRQSRFGRFLAHHHRAQLAVVAHEDELW